MAGSRKGVGGRPRIELENLEFDGWDQLDALIVWATEAYCAERIGISVEALATRIKERTGLSFPEYKKQKQEGIRVNLLKKQYDVAMQGNVPMLIWLGKQHLGQSEKIQAEAVEKKPTEELIADAKTLIKQIS